MSAGYDMRSVAPTVCRILGVRSPNACEATPLHTVVASMGPVVRLAVVVIDALGVTTWAATRHETPTLTALADRRLLHLRSVMPTITPVNFATMLTGAGPNAHTIRSKTEPLQLETVFDVLRATGCISATAARAQSSLGLLISPHADAPGLAASNTDDEVTQIAVAALRRRAELLWVQLLDVDDAGHRHGPISAHGTAAVHRADQHLRAIATEAQRHDYGLVVLADHGQHTVVTAGRVEGGTHGTPCDEDVDVPFVWANPDDVGRALGVP
jgi:predicted AlkP superfamily pyrophosphatase or phosphodiesterase